MQSDNVIFNFYSNTYNAVTQQEDIKKDMGAKKLLELTQIHTDKIIVVERYDEANMQEADAIMTHIPEIALMIKTADCQAFALFDPVKNVIANIHVGWRSLIVDIIPKTITTMEAVYKSNPNDIQVIAVPSLGTCCSEFGDPYNEIPTQWHSFINKNNNHVDLIGIAHKQFAESGVQPEHIKRISGCTSCDTNSFFSHRKGNNKRMATVIMLPKEV